MHSIGMDDVGNAILIMLLLLVVSVSIVGGLMFWLYRFFKYKDHEKKQTEDQANAQNKTDESS